MSINFKFNKGFTLIELITVVSVISILSVIGIAGFNNYNQSQILQAAASDVATTLNLAKSRALSQVKLGAVCTSSNTLEAYEVRLSMSGPFNRYQLVIHCGPLEHTVDDKALPKNIIFDAAGTSQNFFYFPVLRGGVETGGQIVVSGYGRSKTILIDSIGGISVQSTVTVTPVPTGFPSPTPTLIPTATPGFPTLTPTLTPSPGPSPTATPVPPTQTPTPPACGGNGHICCTTGPSCNSASLTCITQPGDLNFNRCKQVFNAFVTSKRFNGDLEAASGENNGLDAGDRLCKQAAEGAGLGGSWKAWISSDGVDARSHIDPKGSTADQPYYRIDGMRILNRLQEIENGSLLNPININENGGSPPTFLVWTGTKADGTEADYTCSDWDTSSTGVSGLRGDTNAIDGSWTDSGIRVNCGRYSIPIYCFEK